MLQAYLSQLSIDAPADGRTKRLPTCGEEPEREEREQRRLLLGEYERQQIRRWERSKPGSTTNSMKCTANLHHTWAAEGRHAEDRNNKQ